MPMPRRSTHAKRAVTILINGRNLIPMVRKHEQPMAKAEGHPNLAGSYAPRSVEEFKKDHTEVVAETHYKPKLSLYACRDCGEVGCWPLEVKITIEGDQVIWQDFEQPHRPEKWDYKTLGPFRFETKAYQQALKAAGLAANS
jgi:hypothetical protein